MKKIVALVLAVVLTAATLSITAAAYSDYDSGYFNGKAWNASLTVRDQYASNKFSYAGGGTVKTMMSVKYYHAGGDYYQRTQCCEAVGYNGSVSNVWDCTNLGLFVIRAEMSAFMKGFARTLYATPDYY